MTTREYEIVIEPHFVKNFWRGRDGYMPMAIVEHMMQGTLEETRRYFNGEEGAYYVSAHYGVARDGRIWQFVRDEDTAWANGILQQPDTSIDWLQEVYEEKINANLVTLAIEYEGYSGEELTEAQYEAALVLHQHLLERWNIPVTRAHLLGHDRFDSVERSRNPGPAFPWERLLADLAHLMPLSKPQQTSPAATEYPLNLEPLPALDKFGFLTESEKPLPDFYNVDFGFLAEPEPEPEIKLINLPDFQESDAKIGPVSDLEEFRFATEPEMRPEGIFPFTEPELVNFASFQESATEVELLPDLYGVSPTVEPAVEQVSQFKLTEPETIEPEVEQVSQFKPTELEMDWLGSLRESATEPATLSSAIEAAVELDWLSLLQAEELEPITATAPKPKVESDWLSALRDPEAEPLIAVESEPESLVEVQNLAPNLESEWLDLLQSTKAESEPLTVVEPKVEPIAEFQAEGESEWLGLLQATESSILASEIKAEATSGGLETLHAAEAEPLSSAVEPKAEAVSPGWLSLPLSPEPEPLNSSLETEADWLDILQGVTPERNPKIEPVFDSPPKVESDWLGVFREVEPESRSDKIALEPESESEWLGFLHATESAPKIEPTVEIENVASEAESEWLGLLHATESTPKIEPVVEIQLQKEVEIEADWQNFLHATESAPLSPAIEADAAWQNFLRATEPASEQFSSATEPKAETDAAWQNFLRATKPEPVSPAVEVETDTAWQNFLRATEAEPISPAVVPEATDWLSSILDATAVPLSPPAEPEVEVASDWLTSFQESDAEPKLLSPTVEPKIESNWLDLLHEPESESVGEAQSLAPAFESDWLDLSRAIELEPLNSTLEPEPKGESNWLTSILGTGSELDLLSTIAPEPEVQSGWRSVFREVEPDLLSPAVESKAAEVPEGLNLIIRTEHAPVEPEVESDWLDLLPPIESEPAPLTSLIEPELEIESDWLSAILDATPAPKLEPVGETQNVILEGESDWLSVIRETRPEPLSSAVESKAAMDWLNSLRDAAPEPEVAWLSSIKETSPSLELEAQPANVSQIVELELEEAWSLLESAANLNVSEPELEEVWPLPEGVASLNVSEPELEEVLPEPKPLNFGNLAETPELPELAQFEPFAASSMSSLERDPLEELDDPILDKTFPPQLKGEYVPTLLEVMQAEPDLPDFEDFDRLFDQISGFGAVPAKAKTEAKPFAVEITPPIPAPFPVTPVEEKREVLPPPSFPVTPLPSVEEKREVLPPPPDELKGLILAEISGGAVSVELANIRTRPTYDPSSIMRTATRGVRLSFDGYLEGPELQGSTRWFHIVPSEGSGWIHSVLVRLDQPFNP